MASPEVSVIMPVFNTSEELLRRSIRSVATQRDIPVELIICDDGSTPETWGLINQLGDNETFGGLPIYAIRHSRNKGPSAARNTALEYASGSKLVWLDSDDELAPDAIKNLWDISQDDTTKVALSACRVIGRSGQEYVNRSAPYVELIKKYMGSYENPLIQTIFTTQAMMVDKEAFKSIYGFPYFETIVCEQLPVSKHAEMHWMLGRFIMRFGALSLAATDDVCYVYHKQPHGASSDAVMLTARRWAMGQNILRFGPVDLETDPQIDIVPIGRSEQTGAQHFQIQTSTGPVVPVWHGKLGPYQL